MRGAAGGDRLDHSDGLFWIRVRSGPDKIVARKELEHAEVADALISVGQGMAAHQMVQMVCQAWKLPIAAASTRAHDRLRQAAGYAPGVTLQPYQARQFRQLCVRARRV